MSPASSRCRCWPACSSLRAASACWPSRCSSPWPTSGCAGPDCTGHTWCSPRCSRSWRSATSRSATWCPEPLLLEPRGVADGHAVRPAARVGVQIEGVGAAVRELAPLTVVCPRRGDLELPARRVMHPDRLAAALEDERVRPCAGVTEPFHVRAQIADHAVVPGSADAPGVGLGVHPGGVDGVLAVV